MKYIVSALGEEASLKLNYFFVNYVTGILSILPFALLISIFLAGVILSSVLF